MGLKETFHAAFAAASAAEKDINATTARNFANKSRDFQDALAIAEVKDLETIAKLLKGKSNGKKEKPTNTDMFLDYASGLTLEVLSVKKEAAKRSTHRFAQGMDPLEKARTELKATKSAPQDMKTQLLGALEKKAQEEISKTVQTFRKSSPTEPAAYTAELARTKQSQGSLGIPQKIDADSEKAKQATPLTELQKKTEALGTSKFTFRRTGK